MNVTVLKRESPFVFRWPAGMEKYEECMQVKIQDKEGRADELFIAYGYRKAFGHLRRRILIFRNEANVLAEFVGVDNWMACRQVATFIRQEGTKKYLRAGEPIPARYIPFDVTESMTVISGPYAPRCIAVTVNEEDVPAMVAVALAREQGQITSRGDKSVGSDPTVKIGGGRWNAQFGYSETVVEALQHYRNRQQTGGSFTGNAKADEFLRQNKFAFLVAASIDRGARAEGVWKIPYNLMQKLGHLDPHTLSLFSIDQMEAMLRSLDRKPRYPRLAAQTIISLSKLVTDEFSGNAASIWQGRQPREVTQILQRISGVGPGIAHMVVRILVDEYGYDPGREGLRQIDVKSDVQVTKVFYRTGIAPDRSQNASVRVARQLHPQFPGLLDWPAWEIGRNWCHEHSPDCAECPLRGICLKRGV